VTFATFHSIESNTTTRGRFKSLHLTTTTRVDLSPYFPRSLLTVPFIIFIMTLLDYCKEQLEAELERLTRTLAEVRVRNEEQFILIDQLEKEQQVLQLSVEEKTKQVEASAALAAATATVTNNPLDCTHNENTSHATATDGNSENRRNKEHRSPSSKKGHAASAVPVADTYRQLQRNISLMEDILNRSLMKEESVSNSSHDGHNNNSNNSINNSSSSSIASLLMSDSNQPDESGIDDDYMSWFDKASAVAAAASTNSNTLLAAPSTPKPAERATTNNNNSTLKDSLNNFPAAALLMSSPRLTKKEPPSTSSSAAMSRNSLSRSSTPSDLWNKNQHNIMSRGGDDDDEEDDRYDRNGDEEDNKSLGSRDGLGRPYPFRRSNSNASSNSSKKSKSKKPLLTTTPKKNSKKSAGVAGLSDLGSKLEWIKRQDEPSETLEAKLERLRHGVMVVDHSDDRPDPGNNWFQDMLDRKLPRSTPQPSTANSTKGSNSDQQQRRSHGGSSRSQSRSAAAAAVAFVDAPHPLETLLRASSDNGSDTLSQSSSQSNSSSSKRGILQQQKHMKNKIKKNALNASFTDRIQKELLLKQGFVTDDELNVTNNTSFSSLPSLESPRPPRRAKVLTGESTSNNAFSSEPLEFDMSFVTAKAMVTATKTKKSTKEKKEHSLSRALRLEGTKLSQQQQQQQQQKMLLTSPESPRHLTVALERSQSLKWVTGSSPAGKKSTNWPHPLDGLSSSSSSHSRQQRPRMTMERTPSASSFGSAPSARSRRKSQRLPFPEAPIF
jgi:hypothetical protein